MGDYHSLKFRHLLAIVAVAVTSSIASQSQVAYGHGCQAQGACCPVGGVCVERTAFSPVLTLFTIFGIAGMIMISSLNKARPKERLGAIFNVFC